MAILASFVLSVNSRSLKSYLTRFFEICIECIDGRWFSKRNFLNIIFISHLNLTILSKLCIGSSGYCCRVQEQLVSLSMSSSGEPVTWEQKFAQPFSSTSATRAVDWNPRLKRWWLKGWSYHYIYDAIRRSTHESLKSRKVAKLKINMICRSRNQLKVNYTQPKWLLG